MQYENNLATLHANRRYDYPHVFMRTIIVIQLFIKLTMRHSAQDFGEEFPRALPNATGLAFTRTSHVQDERHGMFRGEELSKPTPDPPRRVLFPAHHEISSNLPVQQTSPYNAAR